MPREDFLGDFFAVLIIEISILSVVHFGRPDGLLYPHFPALLHDFSERMTSSEQSVD